MTSTKTATSGGEQGIKTTSTRVKIQAQAISSDHGDNRRRGRRHGDSDDGHDHSGNGHRQFNSGTPMDAPVRMMKRCWALKAGSHTIRDPVIATQ